MTVTIPVYKLPGVRSKIERSEAMKNRIRHEAMEFLEGIENELDPDNFTIEEMREEGVNSAFSNTQVSRCLRYLKEDGYLEVVDEQAGRCRLVRGLVSPEFIKQFAR